MPEQNQFYIVDIVLNGPVSPELLEEQRAFLAALTRDGSLLVAAVVPDVKGRGIAIVRAASPEEVRSIYAGAPVVAAGIATVEVNLLRLTAGTISNSGIV